MSPPSNTEPVQPNLIALPDLSLVVLVGASGSGKSTFARRHFKPTEVISSDFCRGLVADNENDQSATDAAFAVLHFIARQRLAAGRLTVIDATNVQSDARQPLVALAREFHAVPVAIVLNLPERLCHERNAGRPDRDFGPHVVRRQCDHLRRSLRNLYREGFRQVHVLNTPAEIEGAAVERRRLWPDLRHETGPFDLIGDVHGCLTELATLLTRLGYTLTPATAPAASLPLSVQERGRGGEVLPAYHHPAGRRAIFLGDLVDRGPDSAGVLRLVMAMVRAGTALCVPGNHDAKLLRHLKGAKVSLTHGLAETVAQLDAEPAEFRAEVATFLDGLVSHYVLDAGHLVVAHAGMQASMQGRASAAVRAFALYGETTGETDEYGLPVRYNWAAEYRGRAMVVYGHTPVAEPDWLNNSICLDTGAAFGGRLTALRYPERELVSVPAERVYYEPVRPLRAEALEAVETPNASSQIAPTAQQAHDDVLDVADVLGKRLIETRLQRHVMIREEQAVAALEVMSRFAVDPKWLIYLPPTMSPTETSAEPGLLEHPAEAFAYYRREGIEQVVCEEKHMGSRAVVVLARGAAAARRRFGVAGDRPGIVYTRTGRRFFDDPDLETALLDRLLTALDRADFWARFETDWLCLDCELMPWSAKAQDLLRHQYAAVGAAATAALAEATTSLSARRHHLDAGAQSSLSAIEARLRDRTAMVGDYVAAYRRYCWPVRGVADLRLAPFHLLATEGRVHVDQDHRWHMATLAQLCAADLAEPTPNAEAGGATTAAGGAVLLATAHRPVELDDEASEREATVWWEELTARGGEGMVVKPLPFVARGRRGGPIQPAIKCRGREYLRIIYGPEYTAPEHLARLRQRGVSAKRALALREFALGVEALERFVRREPLRRVHECVFGVLALETEPVDPRL